MRKKKAFGILVILFLAVLINLITIRYNFAPEDQMIHVNVTVRADEPVSAKVYYIRQGQKKNAYTESQSSTSGYTTPGEDQVLNFDIPADTVLLRFDPADTKTDISFRDFVFIYKDREIAQNLTADQIEDSRQADSMTVSGNTLSVLTKTDTWFAWKTDDGAFIRTVSAANATQNLVKKILICAVVDFLAFLLIRYMDGLCAIPLDIWRNKRLVFNLSKNDFKSKFAGQYLGIIWAFVQPIVTVVVYWFVFEKALNVGTQSTKSGLAVPYVLWLIAGLVPWFYFSEVLSTGTNSMVEYSYLVKKVVFKIDILPVVKLISSLYVHLFFIGFMFVMFFCYRYSPTLYMLQIFYYSIAMALLALGFIYLTSALTVFFRDLSQVIGILLQVGVWATPIMWNIDAMTNISPTVLAILKLNPMYYIVVGYRDAMINNVWFWERPTLTLYFWVFVLFVFIIGTTVYRRLQVHFADVL